MFTSFNLPHGSDKMDMDDNGAIYHQPLNTTTSNKGSSDDEESQSSDIFVGGASLSNSPAQSTAKTQKSLRRTSFGTNDGDSQPTPPKKARTASLFVGRDESLELESDDADEVPPQTSGMSIGMRLSSLNLDQQETNSDGSENTLSRKNFNLSQHFNSYFAHGEASRRQFPAPSDQCIETDQFSSFFGNEHRSVPYDLRQNIDREGAIGPDIDVDQSGNYDPAEEEARQKAERSRQRMIAKRNKKNSAKRKGKGKAASQDEENPAPLQDRWKLIVRLAFDKNSDNWDAVQDITGDYDDWPDNHSDPDDDAQADRLYWVNFYRHRSPSAEAQMSIPDPAGEEPDLTGHPVARGCIDCRLKKQDCSAVKDGCFPCTECMNNMREKDCRPIVCPGLTGRCKRCEDLKQDCSFERTNEDEEAVCDTCWDEGIRDCERRPPTELKFQRIDLNQILYSKDRELLSCTHCREQKKHCSLKKSDEPPCKRCKKEAVGCHFYKTASRKKKSKGAKELENDNQAGEPSNKRSGHDTFAPEVSISGRDVFTAQDLAYFDCESSPEEADVEENPEPVIMDDADGHRGLVTKIKTCFAHPMSFLTDPRDEVDCNFCEMPTFGLLGHFEREVHVLEWNDGRGYTELANGHGEDGTTGPTNMCQPCTASRLQIIACPKHNFKKRTEASNLNYNAAMKSLIAAQGRSPEAHWELQRWCSMCFSLASYECRTAQEAIISIEDRELDSSATLTGCGFRLCVRCAREFAGVYDRNLDDMAAEYDKMDKARADEDYDDGSKEMGTIRADVGLLRGDGILMRSVASGMEDADDDYAQAEE